MPLWWPFCSTGRALQQSIKAHDGYKRWERGLSGHALHSGWLVEARHYLLAGLPSSGGRSVPTPGIPGNAKGGRERMCCGGGGGRRADDAEGGVSYVRGPHSAAKGTSRGAGRDGSDTVPVRGAGECTPAAPFLTLPSRHSRTPSWCVTARTMCQCRTPTPESFSRLKWSLTSGSSFGRRTSVRPLSPCPGCTGAMRTRTEALFFDAWRGRAAPLTAWSARWPRRGAKAPSLSPCPVPVRGVA